MLAGGHAVLLAAAGGAPLALHQLEVWQLFSGVDFASCADHLPCSRLRIYELNDKFTGIPEDFFLCPWHSTGCSLYAPHHQLTGLARLFAIITTKKSSLS